MVIQFLDHYAINKILVTKNHKWKFGWNCSMRDNNKLLIYVLKQFRMYLDTVYFAEN